MDKEEIMYWRCDCDDITSIAGCNSAKSGKNSVDSAAQKTETSSEKSDDSKKAEAPQIAG